MCSNVFSAVSVKSVWTVSVHLEQELQLLQVIWRQHDATGESDAHRHTLHVPNAACVPILIGHFKPHQRAHVRIANYMESCV